MKIITTTNIWKRLAKIVNTIREAENRLTSGRHNKLEVWLIKFPAGYNTELNDITSVNTYYESFSLS